MIVQIGYDLNCLYFLYKSNVINLIVLLTKIAFYILSVIYSYQEIYLQNLYNSQKMHSK